jgi:hypothetical protein
VLAVIEHKYVGHNRVGSNITKLLTIIPRYNDSGLIAQDSEVNYLDEKIYSEYAGFYTFGGVSLRY